MRLTIFAVGLVVLLAPVAGTTAAAGGAAEDVTLRVTVVDATGTGLGDAEVTVTYDDESQTRETFSNGETLFDVPKGATVQIAVSHPTLVKNRPKTIESVDSSTDTTITMYEPATGTITVEDADGPVANANVNIWKDGTGLPAAGGKTGSDGTFTAENVETGSYLVVVEKPGYFKERKTISVSGETSETMTLEQGRVTATFTVVDPHFEEPRQLQALIELADDSGTAGSVRTDRSGASGLTVDVNTKYTVTVSKDGYETKELTMSVKEDDLSRTFEILRTPTLTVEAANEKVVVGETVGVTVTDEYGEVVEGAEIQVDGSGVATTDESGEATVEIQTAGDVEIVAANGSVVSEAITVQGVDPSTDTPEQTSAQSTEDPSETAGSTTAAGEAGDESGSTPGFGLGGALLALVAVALVATRRS
ncbi:carboxypeptidase-like regulatory domain-containing protein [Haloarchaeobius sp. TZWWS8]|uniref:carboxypeptidase-like regulatory domain-containing protein n=1 Tax=Haloarchaeobius sp. TZWWS8 TaxID=3446121 RepID=UPI003EBF47F5